MINMILDYSNKNLGIGITVVLTPNDITILLIGLALYKLAIRF